MEEKKENGVSIEDLSEEVSSNKESNTETKKQSAEENKIWAERRRAWAKDKAEKEAEINRLKDENARIAFKTKAESVDSKTLEILGINEVSTEEDLKLVDAYKKAVSEEKDNPVSEAYKEIYNSRKTEISNKKKHEDLVKADYEELVKKYGVDVPSISKLMEDELFRSKYAPLLSSDKPNLSKVYGIYKEEKDRILKESRDEAKKDSSIYGKVSGKSSDNVGHDDESLSPSKLYEEYKNKRGY